ncbi:RidA family protein [Kitasatospora sp. NPDC058965]|uniref:RidA family protein n=1 Tax=Kitasatospora sp. NPDC058965 TaxID=3346682 RepID=UPI00369DE29E
MSEMYAGSFDQLDGISGAPAPPVTLGPYSATVTAGGLVFVSAQAGVDPDTGAVPPGGFEAECKQAFANLVQAVASAGVGAPDIVKVTVLYSEPDGFPTVNSVFASFFPERPPARTSAIVQLAGGKRIAVDAIAVAADRGRA